MSKHLRRDLDRVSREIVQVGRLVEEMIRKATIALTDRRAELAAEVIEADNQIDAAEVQVEEDLLKILALHQPVANDLRYVVALLKLNNDLERMGDLASNVAKQARFLAERDPLTVTLEFAPMVEVVRQMISKGLDALIGLDANQARQVVEMDDVVDRADADISAALIERMQQDPSTVERAIRALRASRHLERIGDLATHIAEDVVFMNEGEVIRHRAEDYFRESRRLGVAAEE